MKYILILFALLAHAHASIMTVMEEQYEWQVMKSSPLEEKPFALHSLLKWVEPTVIELPPSTFAVRKGLIEGLVYHYNTYTKPHVDLKLMLSYTLKANEMFNIHSYINDDLKVFAEDFINSKRVNLPTLNHCRFILESTGKYSFEDCC
jgi:hypothetical protein